MTQALFVHTTMRGPSSLQLDYQLVWNYDEAQIYGRQGYDSLSTKYGPIELPSNYRQIKGEGGVTRTLGLIIG